MRHQSKREEQLNALTHGFGALLGIVGLILLIRHNTQKTDWSLFSVIVYGISIITLFSASALYHSVRPDFHKHYFRIVDHISIYFLIAGTYTPVLLITLEQSRGWPLFWTVWGIAIFGIILKLFFTGRFEIFSTLLYLVMGWLIVFDFSALSDNVEYNAILFLFAGGLFYTLGIVFYVIERIPYNHVVWHFFVLGGAICHFFMIFKYII
ncbi:hemolysin III family protein [Yeosuana sp. MJ-SS3]|uniref:Hemolysin III family protein n=1 Tax=Gilvirhabdus luticola TaxID=3079858 RepID=A0ABU3UA31_9FLAO|nr:hemolysin III family protein [Yeosuana sp. MJ-SS3]MDU8887171.1 hemolysin III family protein [Yeosuana sp. MJ-SS3]